MIANLRLDLQSIQRRLAIALLLALLAALGIGVWQIASADGPAGGQQVGNYRVFARGTWFNGAWVAVDDNFQMWSANGAPLGRAKNYSYAWFASVYCPQSNQGLPAWDPVSKQLDRVRQVVPRLR